jgi:hypothetical protein
VELDLNEVLDIEDETQRRRFIFVGGELENMMS